MDYQPWIFVGSGRLEKLASEASKALLSWAQHWGYQTDGIEACGASTLAMERCSAEPARKLQAIQVAGQAVAWLSGEEGAATAVLGTLSSLQPQPATGNSSELSEELGCKILLDFFGRLVGLTAEEGKSIQLELTDSIPEPIVSRWSGATYVSFSIGSVRLAFFLSHECTQRVVRGPQSEVTRSANLAPMKEAIRGTSLAVSVCAPVSGGLPLCSFDELVEGSVVILDRRPDSPWTVHGPDGRPLAIGKLGRIGEHFAIQLSQHKST